MSAAVWFGGAVSVCAVSCVGLASGLVMAGAVVPAGLSPLLTSVDVCEFGWGTAGAAVVAPALWAAVSVACCATCGAGVAGVPVLASAWGLLLGGFGSPVLVVLVRMTWQALGQQGCLDWRGCIARAGGGCATGPCPSRRVLGTWADPSSWSGCWLPRGGCAELGRLVLEQGVCGGPWQEARRHVEGAFAVVVAGVVSAGVVWELVVGFCWGWYQVAGSRLSSEVDWVRH